MRIAAVAATLLGLAVAAPLKPDASQCSTDADCNTNAGSYCMNGAGKTPPFSCHAINPPVTMLHKITDFNTMTVPHCDVLSQPNSSWFKDHEHNYASWKVGPCPSWFNLVLSVDHPAPDVQIHHRVVDGPKSIPLMTQYSVQQRCEEDTNDPSMGTILTNLTISEDVARGLKLTVSTATTMGGHGSTNGTMQQLDRADLNLTFTWGPEGCSKGPLRRRQGPFHACGRTDMFDFSYIIFQGYDSDAENTSRWAAKDLWDDQTYVQFAKFEGESGGSTQTGRWYPVSTSASYDAAITYESTFFGIKGRVPPGIFDVPAQCR